MSELSYALNIPEISFGRFSFGDKLNSKASSATFSEFSEENVEKYISRLSGAGYDAFESRCVGSSSFYAFKKGNDAVYISYYPTLAELRIVTEKDSAYIKYRDVSRAVSVQTNVTQINLLDFGLSYVIRLSDSRFIVFDGGWDWEEESDKLMNVLKAYSVDEKPVIAAWILTHQHCDHYWTFVTFHEKYGNDVIIEKVFLSFAEPIPEFMEKYPGSFEKHARGNDFDFTVKLYKYIKDCGADVYCPHTGQSYQIGNAYCEVLSSPDDTCRTPVTDTNHLSLIIKMTLEGQSILWCGDAYFEPSKLVERYGKYLKSDIMQLPHHGFIGGTVEGYNAINPSVVLASTFDDDSFVYMNIHKPDNWHLCKELNVDEYICGRKYNGSDRTINIPYTPDVRGKEKLDDMVRDGLGFCGARVWYFDGLVLEENKECLLNIIKTSGKFDVYVDFIFEDYKYGATAVKIDISKGALTRFNLNGINIIENNPVQYERTFWRKCEIPMGIPFAIRVYGKRPFVASCDSGREIYHY